MSSSRLLALAVSGLCADPSPTACLTSCPDAGTWVLHNSPKSLSQSAHSHNNRPWPLALARAPGLPHAPWILAVLCGHPAVSVGHPPADVCLWVPPHDPSSTGRLATPSQTPSCPPTSSPQPHTQLVLVSRPKQDNQGLDGQHALLRLHFVLSAHQPPCLAAVLEE